MVQLRCSRPSKSWLQPRIRPRSLPQQSPAQNPRRRPRRRHRSRCSSMCGGRAALRVGAGPISGAAVRTGRRRSRRPQPLQTLRHLPLRPAKQRRRRKIFLPRPQRIRRRGKAATCASAAGARRIGAIVLAANASGRPPTWPGMSGRSGKTATSGARKRRIRTRPSPSSPHSRRSSRPMQRSAAEHDPRERQPVFRTDHARPE